MEMFVLVSCVFLINRIIYFVDVSFIEDVIIYYFIAAVLFVVAR